MNPADANPIKIIIIPHFLFNFNLHNSMLKFIITIFLLKNYLMQSIIGKEFEQVYINSWIMWNRIKPPKMLI